MVDAAVEKWIEEKPGFIAALDQSGGSTPGALKAYGIADGSWKDEADMYRLVHEMRVRIISAPAFTGDKILGAILFERTMDGEAHGKPVPVYLREDRQVLPFLKVDKGLEAEANGVQVMKAMPDLDALLKRAVAAGIVGTKMRSVISQANVQGIAAVVDQQFDVGDQIAAHGLMPIIEPEVSIKSVDKTRSESILMEEILRRLDALPNNRKVMLKLTIPTVPDFYKPLIEHPRVARVVALSGGYSRDQACALLADNHGMIASFSRALVDGLKAGMSDAEFNAALGRSIDQIFKASMEKVD